ncbi:lipopolysaccharide transport periplasmic protein LptA [Pseudoxanthomonas gei]|uniref:Lipopolysaccharide export system protein LptA n=2 Tax=Pseudoxanthomonas gei TaxID=1383030 RepID=A0ABX0AC59_9GAMM|nr:lipopolysaccharide transport periplasmic protein LptA [Pseudoxanthomonas gei]
MNPTLRASLFAVLALSMPGLTWAKSSDRNQPIYLDSNNQEGVMDGNSTNVWTGNVTLKQGSLDISAQRAELTQRNGDPSLAVFTGSPVRLRQQQDDGTWMDATASRIEYNMSTETITLIGNYTVKSPRGSNSGQRMVYNTKTGSIKSGGDGTRVKTVIQPKSAGTAKPPEATK